METAALLPSKHSPLIFGVEAAQALVLYCHACFHWNSPCAISKAPQSYKSKSSLLSVAKILLIVRTTFQAVEKVCEGMRSSHHDQHHSFQVNIQGNYWNCYAEQGCGGGSIIHFWQKWREVHGQSPDFKETVTELAQMLL